jgi:hypothetical protein
MGERRMFSMKIINTSKFLRLPNDTQNLYFHLGLRADDDGIVEAYPVMKTIGASEDSLKLLHAKELIKVLNDDLITYITDWSEHNSIRADRKVDSIYKDLLIKILPEVKLLESRERADRPSKKSEVGQPMDGNGTSHGQPMDGISKDKLSKDKLSKDKKTKTTKPDLFDLINNFTNNDELKTAITQYLEMRKEKKKAPTANALDLIFQDLKKLSSDTATQIKILQESTKNSWTGVFPLKEINQPDKPKPKVQQSANFEQRKYEDKDFDQFYTNGG